MISKREFDSIIKRQLVKMGEAAEQDMTMCALTKENLIVLVDTDSPSET